VRILIVTNTYPPADISGVGALAVELSRELGTRGHEARVLTRAAAADDRHAIATGGPKLAFPILAALAYLRLEPFDLVHVHESDGALLALVVRALRALGRQRGRPRLIATLQVSYRRERLAVREVRAAGRVVSRPTRSELVFAWLRAPILSLLGRLVAALADVVVAPSRATARELEEDYGARRVTVIPNGVEPASPAAAAASSGAPAGFDPPGPVVLYAGRLRTRKAVAVLVQAFAAVAAKVPGATLVLAGDGEQRPSLERQASELGIAGRLRFLGALPRAEMAALYARADVFCLPSTYEGMPLAILEAMAHGLPVVATAVSGNPEAVEDGVSGLLVPPEDSERLAEALIRLLADADLRRELGEAGRARLAASFGRERVTRAYVGVYTGAPA
jgi:glycosyltransferase involved in cell wall biosynthesis